MPDDRVITVYTCGVSWEHHLDSDPNGTMLYPSVEALRDARSCVDECGIVELKVMLVSWVQDQKLP